MSPLTCSISDCHRPACTTGAQQPQFGPLSGVCRSHRRWRVWIANYASERSRDEYVRGCPECGHDIATVTFTTRWRTADGVTQAGRFEFTTDIEDNETPEGGTLYLFVDSAWGRDYVLNAIRIDRPEVFVDMNGEPISGTTVLSTTDREIERLRNEMWDNRHTVLAHCSSCETTFDVEM